MTRYSAGFSRAGINTANSPVANLSNTGTTDRVYVMEIGIGVAVAPATAPMFYLARATARGTQTATLGGQAHDAGDGTPVGSLDTTWSVNPTFSTTAFMRMGGLAITAGGFLIWTFYDKPIVIDKTAASGLVLANANAAGATLGTFAGYFCWGE